MTQTIQQLANEAASYMVIGLKGLPGGTPAWVRDIFNASELGTYDDIHSVLLTLGEAPDDEDDAYAYAQESLEGSERYSELLAWFSNDPTRLTYFVNMSISGYRSQCHMVGIWGILTDAHRDYKLNIFRKLQVALSDRRKELE